jgi:hypothetical protein
VLPGRVGRVERLDLALLIADLGYEEAVVDKEYDSVRAAPWLAPRQTRGLTHCPRRDAQSGAAGERQPALDFGACPLGVYLPGCVPLRPHSRAPARRRHSRSRLRDVHSE